MAKNSQSPLISIEDLRPYLKLVGKNWWLMLGLTIAGYAIGRLVTHRLVDVHRATAELLLDQSDGAGVDAMLNSRNALRGFNYYNDEVQNQLRVLRSYDLVGRAIDKIDDPLDCFLVGRLKEMPVESFGALDIEVNMEGWSPSMTSKDIDIHVLDSESCRVVLNSNLGKEGQTEFILPFDQRLTKNGLDLMVRLDSTVASDVDKLANAKALHFRIRVKSRDQRIRQYRSALSTTNIERTSVITLTCNDVLTKRAIRFLDTLAATYIEYTAEASLSTNVQTERFINNQLVEINALTDTLERQVDYYRAQNEVLDLTREQSSYFNTLVEIEQELRTLDNQALSLDQLESFLVSPDEIGLPPSSYFMMDDPWMADQIAEMMALEARRSTLLLDAQPGSYQVRKLDSLARHLRANVVSYLAEKVGNVERQRMGLKADILDLEAKLSGLPKTQRDILAMERKLGVNEKLAVYLLERKAATIIARASITPKASLIERARYAGKVGPDSRRTILTNSAIGFLVALAIAVARMVLFERIESTSELREVASAPVIGGIPHYPDAQGDPIACRADNRSAVTEAFRALRTNLQYLLAKEGANVILVSSLHPQEGKSFVSANLASILAKAGKKVALVDFDLHKPRVHEYMWVDKNLGTSNLLIGKATLDSVLKPGTYPSLDVITSGPIPPNASDLILSERMQETIAGLKAAYDYVILDTPPILLISDALVLMKHVDTALLITHVDRSARRGVRHLEDLLDQNGLKHASFVLNGVKTRRWAHYYNRYAAKYGYATYGSDYGYGYGYGGDRYEEPT